MDLDRSIFQTTQLGSLIAALSKQPADNLVRFDFCGLVPRGVDSYRGFYDHLAIGWGPDQSAFEETKVAGLLAILRGAVGRSFSGWKGGNYVMREDTPVWVANPGQCDSTAIVGVESNSYMTVIQTQRVEV